MKKEKKIIKLSNIECTKIVEKIKEGTNIVVKFSNVLSNHLGYKKLKPPQIFIVRSECNAYEDDGNTKTPGYEYNVYWCFPYINVFENVDIHRLIHFDSFMWPRTLLFFQLNIKERIEDHEYNGGHHFSLYITEEPKKENVVRRLAWYNDNFDLNAMLNAENIQECIEDINDTYNRILFKQTIIEELEELVDMPDIEEFIANHCKQ